MKKLLLLAAIVAFGVSLCGTAMAAKIYGQVWLGTGVGEEAACAMVFVYNAAGCDPEDYRDQMPTDSCGNYEFTGFGDDSTFYFHIEFPILECTMGSYWGTCPYTEIECEGVYVGFGSDVDKDWFLGLPNCANVGCP